ncbi:MAG: BrnA antitoxin family protein [Gammaproteobacteria bacterium]|nr:BrnA antitoxin family protein [Gammaproteobacteria bacterium]
MKKKSQTDWAKLENMTDDEIDYTDIPPLDDEFFTKGELRLPKRKPLISIRIDPEVLSWFKSEGPGYQTRMNAVLRMYMEAQTRKLRRIPS